MHSITDKPGTMGRAYRPLPFRMLFSFLIIVVLAMAAPVSADLITIHTLNPGDSIQENITTANPGDTIILNPGTYYPASQISVSRNINIQANVSKGGSPANTVIDGSGCPEGIFAISDGVNFAVDNLTLQNGARMLGGGAISAMNVNSPGTLTVTSTVFRNCSAENGGAIGISSNARTTSITASTFINCSASSMGGAIYSGENSLSVISSAFSGCFAASEGGAILTTSTSDITSSSFSDCNSGAGGAVATSSATIDIHFSRFYNVTSANTQSDAIYCWYGDANVTDNWWGSSNEPSTSTTLYMYGGPLSYNPWLVLNVTAKPSTLSTAQTSVIRANLTWNSAGTDTAGGGIFVPAGTPVMFRRTSGTGTLALYNGNMTSGTNTSRFTPAGAGGTSRIAITVDGETIPVPVTAVSHAPVANFTATPRTGLFPLTVRFTDLSTNIPASWKWTFGDSSAVNSTEKNPVHTYAAPGTYTVTLKVSNILGSNTTRKTGYITVTAPSPKVTAISPASGKRGALVAVTNLSGTGFRAGAKVYLNKTGSASLSATNVSIVSATKITCTVKIPAMAVIGSWDVMVRNTDGKSGKKAGIFTVKTPLPPTVTGITPASGSRGQLIQISNLAGTGFVASPKPTVQLLRGTASINATNITVVNTGRITCTVKVPATAATGAWKARVTNADKQAGTLAPAFTVTA